MGKFGVWSYCERCHQDTWVVAWERDYLDEPISYICGGGCDEDEDDWGDEA